ncbi:molybdopterin biosynthesis protein MoeA [Aeropyrum pernix]|uniref:Molybdopterin biosynthesis protein MoeA n=1 Tax=Aeropyrum pernix TaxID=56636 RepID=A0A401H9H2_AERPX|nr:molybdopterin molybdotransferase MoeA [Aeropyrum pernix]GBF09105.1 molybdopterin biosynthesis protein MoeA [Aeropyrum pernix]
MDSGIDRGKILSTLHTLEEAIARAAGRLEVLRGPLLEKRESLGLAAAIGRPLARKVVARGCHPPYPRVNLDGCAVDSSRVSRGSVLRVTARLRPGMEPVELVDRGGGCVWVDTGAPLPVGADAVVPLEELDVLGEGVVRLEAEPRRWTGVADPCSDAMEGSVVLGEGEVVTPEAVASLASAGVHSVEAGSRLRACVASVGDELRSLEECREGGGVCETNRLLARSRLEATGVEVVDLGIHPDRPETLPSLAAAARGSGCHILVTSGGSSVGLSDYALAGPEDIVVRGLAIRPGRPTTLSIVDGIPVYSLPGNPRSAGSAIDLFLLPSLAAAGLPVATVVPGMRAVLLAGVKPGRRLSYIPVAAVYCGGRLYAVPVSTESYMTVSWAAADGYIAVEPGKALEPGEEARVTIVRGVKRRLSIDYTGGLGGGGYRVTLAKPPHGKVVAEALARCPRLEAVVTEDAAGEMVEAGTPSGALEPLDQDIVVAVNRKCGNSIIAAPRVLEKSGWLSRAASRLGGEILYVDNVQSSARLAAHGYTCGAVTLKSLTPPGLRVASETRIRVYIARGWAEKGGSGEKQ